MKFRLPPISGTLLSGIKRQQGGNNAPQPGLLQASDTTRRAPRAQDIARNDAGSKRLDSTAMQVASEEDIPTSKPILRDVVKDGDAQRCLVLDIGLREVIVVGTPEFFGSGALTQLRAALSTKSYKLVKEFACTADTLSRVRANNLAVKAGNGAAAAESEKTHKAMYQELIAMGHELRASDLHITLDSDIRTAQVELRIDGSMKQWKEFDYAAINSALAAAYHGLAVRGTNSAATWTTERPISVMTRTPSKGSVPLHGRLTTQPIAGGLFVVIRIAVASEDHFAKGSFEKLGFTHQQISEELQPALARTDGFILVAGSTGDGKTTTLHRMLLDIPNRDEVNIVAVEDPNENRIPRVKHISIPRNPDDSPDEVERKYNSSLINLMRLDPDVILQGEVRDRISGEFAGEALLTGHLLLMSSHGSSAIDMLQRLTEHKIAMPTEIIGSKFFNLVMSQKLLPLLCTKCRRPASDILSHADLEPYHKVYGLNVNSMNCANPDGCPACSAEGMRGNGVRGRTVAAEIITFPSAEFLHCVRRRDWDGARILWRRTRRAAFDHPDMRGKTSFEHGLYSVSQGLVDPRTLQRIFPDEWHAREVIPIMADSERLKLVSNQENS